MLTQIIDAVIVVDTAILFYLIQRAKTILRNHQRLFITIPILGQTVVEAQWIRSPLPWRRIQIRVLAGIKGLHGIFLCVYDTAVVIGNSQELHRILF